MKKKRIDKVEDNSRTPNNIPNDSSLSSDLFSLLEKREESKRLREKEIIERGTVSKLMFDRKCATTPENLYKLVEDYVLHYQFKLGSLSITKFSDQLQITHNDYLSIGHIQCLQINKEEAQVQVVVYQTNRSIDEKKELYGEAIKFFTQLCQRFDTYWPFADQNLLHPKVQRSDLPVQPSLKSKRGPHRYSEEEKIKAVHEWDELDKDIYPITLAEWLENRFGAEGGILNVAESTFYEWRRRFKPK